MTQLVLQLAIMCLVGNVVFCRKDGAPNMTCFHMVPNHMHVVTGLPISRRNLPNSPYEVKAEIDSITGEYVRLTITGSMPLKGFLIQARETVKSKPIGQFKLTSQSNDSIAKYQECTGTRYTYPRFSSITHTNNDAKDNVTVMWSPVTWNENVTVKFYATLVHSYDAFWVMQPSNEINILDMSSGTPGRHPTTFWTVTTVLATFLINFMC